MIAPTSFEYPLFDGSEPVSGRRFSKCADEYAQHRPRYPSELMSVLAHAGLANEGVDVADLGAGTGLLSQIFLAYGCTVYAIEPNRKMLDQARRALSSNPAFHPVAASAEATTLPGAAVDLVVAGQAFHWFDATHARAECRRILKQGGAAALIWNERRPKVNAFSREYDLLLERFAVDYLGARLSQVSKERGDVDTFFDGPYDTNTIDGQFSLDYNALRGFLLSCSYAPRPSHPAYEPMIGQLGALFEKHERDGRVTFPMQTRIYYGYV